MVNAETRARLRELHEKATAGPVRCGSVKSVVISPSGEAIASYFMGSPDATEQEKVRWQADFDLAIESRNALPGLLADSDALAAVTAERDRLLQRCHPLNWPCRVCGHNKEIPQGGICYECAVSSLQSQAAEKRATAHETANATVLEQGRWWMERAKVLEERVKELECQLYYLDDGDSHPS